MKPFKRILLLLTACLHFTLIAQEIEGLRTRIGILDPEIDGGGDKFLEEVLTIINQSLATMGAYEVFSQKSMEESFADIEQKFPQYCREPRCVAAIGVALQLDRMLYGSIGQGDNTFYVRMTLIDVQSRQVIEKVDIEGDPGITLEEIITIAIGKLHGHVDADLDTKIHRYHGKQVHNQRQLYISAGSCLGLGLIWALVNSKTVEDKVVTADYTDWLDAKSGIGTGADLIPLFGRPSALGNCYVTASDDAYGVFFNPAGLSWSTGGEFSFGYQSRYGLNNFAASFINKATREIGFGQGFIYSGDTEGLFYETVFLSAISYKFNDLISFLRPFSFGATIKLTSKRTGDGSVGNCSISGSSFGVGINYGFQIELSEKIRYGLLVRNAPSVVRWNNEATGKKYYEPEPTELSMGGIFQANYATMLICEGYIPLYKEQVWKFAGGVERVIFRIMRIRLGAAKAEGLDTPWKINGGFGLKIPTEKIWGKYLTLDCSYEYNSLSSFSNVLNFSFRYGF